MVVSRKTGTDEALASSFDESNAPCSNSACSRPVTDSSGGMQCDICSRWYHKSCTGLRANQYKMLSSSESLLFRCADCCAQKAKLPAFTCAEFKALASRFTVVEKALAELASLASLNSKVDLIMKSLNIANVDAVTDCPADSPTVDEEFILPDAPVHVDMTDTDASDGIVDPPQMEGESRAPEPLKNKRKRVRKARKPSAPKPEGDKMLKKQAPALKTPPGVALPSVRQEVPSPSVSPIPVRQPYGVDGRACGVNTPRRGDSYTDSSVIFRNVTESTAALPAERMLEDLDWLKVCVTRLLPPGFPGVTVRKLIRLGNVTVGQPNPRPRLLRVVLSTPEERRALLRFAFKLKGTAVSVQPDLPLADRLKLKEAIRDLKARRAAGEQGLRLVGFQVVSRRSFSALPEPILIAHDPGLVGPKHSK
ncbi:unnamed protein product [Dicrocoelium dendriticum]|nr:unnamed protein product [Dicrocoelium dendriticum]